MVALARYSESGFKLVRKLVGSVWKLVRDCCCPAVLGEGCEGETFCPAFTYSVVSYGNSITAPLGETLAGYGATSNSNDTCDPITVASVSCATVDDDAPACTVYLRQQSVSTVEGNAATPAYRWDSSGPASSTFSWIATRQELEALPSGTHFLPYSFTWHKVNQATGACMGVTDGGTAEVRVSKP